MKIPYSVAIDGKNYSVGPFPFMARSFAVVNQTGATCIVTEDGGAQFQIAALTAATFPCGNTTRFTVGLASPQAIGNTLTLIVSDEDASISVQQLSRLSAEGPPNVLTGKVGQLGNILSGTGYTVSAYTPGSGQYTIVYTTPFAATPVVMINPNQGGTTYPVWQMVASSNTGFTAFFADMDGPPTGQNVQFDFLVTPIQ